MRRCAINEPERLVRARICSIRVIRCLKGFEPVLGLFRCILLVVDYRDRVVQWNKVGRKLCQGHWY